MTPHPKDGDTFMSNISNKLIIVKDIWQSSINNKYYVIYKEVPTNFPMGTYSCELIEFNSSTRELTAIERILYV